MSSAMSVYIILGTIVSMLATLWLIRWSSQQAPDDVAEDQTLNHSWDGDLVELNNPLPRWWLILFYLTIIFGGIYLLLFPGLGSFNGVLGWSQEARYEKQVAAAKATYDPLYAAYAERPIPELAKDPDALALGSSLYANYCSTCHGSDARGAVGFPNLADNDWLYGGSPESITTSILNGRAGLMPATFGQMLGEEKARALAQTVSTLHEAPPGPVTDPSFATCVACHGPEGKGNQALGAPNLRDDIWLYGGDPDTIYQTLMQGRNGMMPAHRSILGEERAHILAAYVYSLSQGWPVSE